MWWHYVWWLSLIPLPIFMSLATYVSQSCSSPHILSFACRSLFFRDIKPVMDIAKLSSSRHSLLFVLRFFFPSIQPQFTHLISSISLSFPSIHTVKCLLLCRSRILVALCLKPCRRVLAAQTYKWTDTKWEKEMKQKAVISCTFIPILFSLCVSSLITRSCCEEVCFVCVGTYWRYHCHVFTCIKEKHSSLRNEKLSWPNFCANKRR